MQSHSRFAKMADPMPEDFERAMIIAAYEAREHLASASRATDGAWDGAFETNWSKSVEMTHAGIVHLGSCHLMMKTLGVDDAKIADLHERAVATAHASISLAQVRKSYERGDTAFEAKQIDKSYRHWQMAAETARKEAHRLLAALAMKFPNAYAIDDD